MRIQEFADKIGVTTTTLRNWDRNGILPAKRTKTGQRFYTDDDYNTYIGVSKTTRKSYGYARVSSRKQQSSLTNQVSFLRNYINNSGNIVETILTDIGSGLNYQRPQWNKLLTMVMQDQVDTIYITYKDRFVRFGFDWFENLCKTHQTKIVIVNNEDTSPESEMIQDLISIVHVFSCRIYGLRKYNKSLKEDEKHVENTDGKTLS